MFTVALIGADGAGKTTVCRRIVGRMPWPTQYVYMGVNLQASNLVLPTTRLVLELKRALGKRPDMAGPPDPTRVKSRPHGIGKAALAELKSALRLVNQVSEEWFRQMVVYYYLCRDRIVLLDRHFYLDYYAHHIAPTQRPRPWANRIHGYLLARFYPRPDLVIFLDAPAELLLARKGEGTCELLEHRRQEYRQLKDVLENYHTVDATQSLDDVTDIVMDLIKSYYCKTFHRKTDFIA
jgi:thymidylate kinase